MKERQSSVLILAAAPEDRAALRDALSRDPAARYVITEVETGLRALEVCRAWKPDCLILELDLPDLSGLDAIKELTAEEEVSTCAVVALVGSGDAQLAVEAMKSGAHDCLEKGRAGMTELRRAVSQAIETAEQRRQASAREHELIKKNFALEADLAVLRREAAWRGQKEEARQVARAAAGSRRVDVSRSERAYHNQAIEEKLRESNETQLRAILDHSTALIFIKDLEGRYLRINHRCEILLGVTESELIGKTDYDIHTREIADALRANDREVITANRPLQFEEQVATADGARHYAVVKFPLYDEGGRPYEVCGIATDITDIKRSETELQESKERLLSALDAADVGIWRVDLKTRMETRDAALNRIIGLPGQTLILPLSDWFDRIHPDEAPRARESWERAMRTGLYDEEHRMVKSDGKVIWVRDRGRIFYDLAGEPLYATGAITDISALKQAEENLRQSEGRFRATFENAAVGIAHVAPDGRWLEVNQRLCDIVSYTCEELLTKTFGDITHPDDLDADWEQARRLLAGEIENYSMEKRYYRKDGSIVWINLTASLMRGADGSPDCGIAVVEDISARKLAEEALKGSEERLNLAMQAGDIGMADWRIRDDVIVLSEKLVEIYGLPPDKTIARYEDWRERVYPEDLPAVEELIWGTFERKLPNWRIEYRIVRADNGEVRWVEARHNVFYDAQGEPLRTTGATLDITEHKQAEEIVRDSEARFRQLADVMPQIDYSCPPNGIVDYANQRWYEYMGASTEQPIEDTSIDALYPDDRERTLRQWRKSVETGRPFELEYRFRRRDGQYRWQLSRGIPIRDRQGRVIKWIGTMTDIHDHKEAEAVREELLALEQAARAEAEHSAESIRRLQAVIDSALAPLTLDDLLHEMLSRIRELLATDFAAILLLTEDEQSLTVRATIGWEETVTGLIVPVGQGLAGSIAARRAPLVVEDLSKMEVINPVLRRKARSLIGAPLIVEGRLIGVIHADTARPRRFTEDDVRLLQLAADRVALAIEHTRLYEVERQARRQAEGANRMKDEFLTLVSHELRSPLNAMLGYAAMLRYGGLDAPKVKQAADVIERSGKAQAQLIDDLLDTARIISGKLRLEVGPVDLVSVIQQAVQTIKPAADAKGISLETDLPSEIGQITGDPVRLQQVVWNLLSNAVKFTPQGGRVEARLERVDPYICIAVSDTGKGINLDFLPYVFNRFSQADASSARRYGGLGLGLALVKYLVELHGGTIEAESAGEGQGAMFRVTLPVRAVATPLGEIGVAPVRFKSSGELAGVRALVVDDEDDARELIETALTQYGADVVAVSSAAEAYTLITTTPPNERLDVIVTDIGMPGEDGYSLIRRVREWEIARGAHTPAVALTAYGRVEDRVRALNADFQMHVAKPVEPAELAAVITSIIRRPMASRQ